VAGISWISRLFGATPAAALLAVSVAQGQTSSPPPKTIEDALHQMSDKAGVIFAGQVLAVDRHEGEGSASGIVEISFRVDQAIRGCDAGTTYVLREWAGLWSGPQRYRVGEERLMFLHLPGASGLSSPVDGMDGVVPIIGSSSQTVNGTPSSPSPVADLKWIGAKVDHPVSYRKLPARPVRSNPVPTPFLVPQPALGTASTGSGAAGVGAAGVGAAGVDPSTASEPEQQAPVSTVIGMLRSWQVPRAAK
jgi:hypothetical protein